MFTKSLSKMLSCFFLCSLLISVSMASAPKRTPARQRPCVDAEKDYLTLLGLPEDANDTVIIQQLDIIGTQPLAMGVIVCRKMYSAVPKLLQIVNAANTHHPEILSASMKMCAARTLCSLGNKDWMPTIKALSLDPNGFVVGSLLKIKCAGLLARGGDYSQFDIVSAAIGDSSKHVRGLATDALRNFGTDSAVDLLLSVANTDPDIWLRQRAMRSLEEIARKKPQIKPRLEVSDSTVELLVSVAKTDPKPWLRQRAIWSLWEIARKKPQTKPRLIYALKVNKDSQDESLRRICRMFLKVNTPIRKDQKGKQP